MAMRSLLRAPRDSCRTSYMLDLGCRYFSSRKPEADDANNRAGFSEEFRRRGVGVVGEMKGSDDYSKVFNERLSKGRVRSSPRELSLKSRRINPLSTVSYVQILGNGLDTQDTSPSILLFFDQQRFLFNVGEGIQRFCSEYHINLDRLEHLLLTRVCSETTGGLPALLMTLARLGEEGKSVNIWGPSNIKYLIRGMRTFVANSAIQHTHGISSTNVNHGNGVSVDSQVLVENEIVKISAVLLLPKSDARFDEAMSQEEFSKNHKARLSSKRVNEDTNTTSIENINFYNRQSLKPKIHELRETSRGNPTSYKERTDVAVAYICELPQIIGKFDPAKARELGLMPGPKYKKLQFGKSVMSDKKNIQINPEDVLSPSVPGPVVLIVDCPTVSHLPALLSASAFNKFSTGTVDSSKELQKSVDCIIHLSPRSVTKNPLYLEWMARFADTQHIMAKHQERQVEFPILRSSGRISTWLNFLCPQLFPAPKIQLMDVENSYEDMLATMEKVSNTKPKKIVPAENLLKFWLRPYSWVGLDYSSVPALPTVSRITAILCKNFPEIFDNRSKEHDDIKEISEPRCQILDASPMNVLRDTKCNGDLNLYDRDVDASFDENQFRLWNSFKNQNTDRVPECLENVNREEMEIVFLGTGSSPLSKFRNVSSIFVNLFSRGGVLLDCGEGTLAQLKKRFGSTRANDVIKSMKMIWISHIHVDHHAGLPRILSMRKELLNNEAHEPLLVVGPKPLNSFLKSYSRVQNLGFHFLDCRQTTKESVNAYENNCADTPDAMERNLQHGYNTILSSVGSRQVYSMRTGILTTTDTKQHILDIAGLYKFKKVLAEAGLESLISVPVIHCPESFAVILKSRERKNMVNKMIPGWKIAFSGDTRPCQDLVDAAYGATVLIHEATLNDTEPERAIIGNHSMTKEAIGMGISAGAYRTILTHFLEPFPKIPAFDVNYTNKISFAFDLMTINLADLPFVPKINPYLKLIFGKRNRRYLRRNIFHHRKKKKQGFSSFRQEVHHFASAGQQESS